MNSKVFFNLWEGIADSVLEKILTDFLPDSY